MGLMNIEQLEAFFLNHDDPFYEQIQEAETEDGAEGLADDALTDAGHTYEGMDLINVVCKIRNA